MAAVAIEDCWADQRRTELAEEGFEDVSVVAVAAGMQQEQHACWGHNRHLCRLAVAVLLLERLTVVCALLLYSL